MHFPLFVEIPFHNYLKTAKYSVNKKCLYWIINIFHWKRHNWLICMWFCCCLMTYHNFYIQNQHWIALLNSVCLRICHVWSKMLHLKPQNPCSIHTKLLVVKAKCDFGLWVQEQHFRWHFNEWHWKSLPPLLFSCFHLFLDWLLSFVLKKSLQRFLTAKPKNSGNIPTTCDGSPITCGGSSDHALSQYCEKIILPHFF